MRYISKFVVEDHETKMVFVAGPRQSGKTTLAKEILSHEFTGSGLYLNWDNNKHRKQTLNQEWTDEQKLIIFNELHKYKRWKGWLKGIYDVERDTHAFIVTGSARLDIYRRGGDSMLGRYHLWHLHPFTLDEYPALGKTKTISAPSGHLVSTLSQSRCHSTPPAHENSPKISSP